MAQNNIENLIKSSFQTERDIPFNESAWEALGDRLDKDRSRSRVLPWWWLLGALLLFSLMGACIFMLSDQLDQAISRVEALEKNSFERGALSVVDTCFEEVTIYRYDTIYRTTIIREVKKTEASYMPLFDSKQNHNTELKKRKIELEKIGTAAGESLTLTNTYSDLEQGLQLSFLAKKPNKKAVTSTKDRTAPDFSPPQIKKRANINFEVGIIYGSEVNPFSKMGLPFPGDSLPNQQTSNYKALRIGLGLGSKLQINISPGVEKIVNQFNTEFPSPYAEEAQSNYAPLRMTINQKSWRIPLEIRYIPFTKHRLQPFIEAGIMAYTRLNADVDIRYYTELPYINPFYDAKYTLSQSAFKINQVTSGFGLIYRFNNKFSAQIAGQYYFKLKPEALLHMRYALQGQIAYRF